jgi:hypothetical protein
MCSSKPKGLAASAMDIVVASVLALLDILMKPLPLQVVATTFLAAAGFALILDQIERSVTGASLRIGYRKCLLPPA